MLFIHDKRPKNGPRVHVFSMPIEEDKKKAQYNIVTVIKLPYVWCAAHIDVGMFASIDNFVADLDIDAVADVFEQLIRIKMNRIY